eukprot:1788945-Pyramimonas_sp.AAC.1
MDRIAGLGSVEPSPPHARGPTARPRRVGLRARCVGHENIHAWPMCAYGSDHLERTVRNQMRACAPPRALAGTPRSRSSTDQSQQPL